MLENLIETILESQWLVKTIITMTICITGNFAVLIHYIFNIKRHIKNAGLWEDYKRIYKKKHNVLLSLIFTVFMCMIPVVRWLWVMFAFVILISVIIKGGDATVERIKELKAEEVEKSIANANDSESA